MSGYDLSEMLFRIKNIKKEKGITNEMLAKTSNISLGTLNKILAGVTKEPSIESIIKIAKALDVPADYLILGTAYSALNNKEQKLINAYNAHPEMQAAINKMLDIENIDEEDDKTKQKLKSVKDDNTDFSYGYLAAKGQAPHLHKINKEKEAEALEALQRLREKNK